MRAPTSAELNLFPAESPGIDHVDRRYQVFISSTFTDLVAERREVMQALLEMDCLPAGMELFPAGNTDQWTLIQGVIEQSDYYLVILGGRYGSITEEGISYTEKEYDFAVERGIPLMGFVPSDLDAIPVGKTDRSDAASKKLLSFQQKVQMRLTRDWKNADDLGSKVTRGLMHLIKNNPRPGWVRGDQAMTAETRTEIAELRASLAQVEKRELEKTPPSQGAINLEFAHGQDVIKVDVVHSGYNTGQFINELEEGDLEYTWDEIIEALGPFMIEETPEGSIRGTLNNHILRDIQADPEGWIDHWAGESAAVTDRSWGSIIVQLRALGLVELGTRKRTASDKSVYWKLTPAGDNYLVNLRAVRASP